MSAQLLDGSGNKRTTRWPFMLSLGLHLLALLAMSLRIHLPEAAPQFQLRMVRLAGGFSGQPGYSAESRQPEAPPVSSPPAVKEQPPVSQSEATPEPAKMAAVESPPVEAEAPELQEPRAEAEKPVRDTMPVASPQQESKPVTQEAAQQPATEAEGVSQAATRAGPAGPGKGAVADQQGLPGLSSWLGRVEAQIQRRFQYPARDTKARAVFHFYIERDGSISDLELRQSSELPGLDHAGRSAITRAVCPPLPAAFRHKRLGVTFTFVDER